MLLSFSWRMFYWESKNNYFVNEWQIWTILNVLSLIISFMGQTLWCFDCCWFADCYCCIGCMQAYWCCSCWICQPKFVAMFRPNWFMVGPCDQGYGEACLYRGMYCCIPEWMKKASLRETIGSKRYHLGDLAIVPAT